MKWIAIGIGVLAALFAALLFIVPSLVPSETYQTTIEEQLTRELGRDVRIEGDVSLSTFPVIRAKAGRATIANPPGYSRELMASIEGLEARIKLWPLFSRHVEIASFTLVQPDILLERRADGAANWVIEAYQSDTPASEDTGPFRRDGRFSNLDPSLAKMRIEDGRLTYRDIAAEQTVDLTEIDATLALPDMSDTLSLEGSMRLDGQAVAADIQLYSPRAFLNGDEARIEGRLEMDAGRMDVDGQFPASDRIAFAGDLSAELTDPAFIQDFLQDPIPALSLLDRVEMVGTATSDGDTTTFETLTAELSGEGLSASYDGTARYDGTISAEGTYQAEASRIQRIAQALNLNVTGLDTVSTASSSGTVSVKGDAIAVRDMKLEATGPQLSARVAGDFSRQGEILGGSGTFDLSSDNVGPLARRFVPDLSPDADVIGRADVKGSIELSGDRIDVGDLELDTASDLLTSQYSGTATLVGDNVRLEGRAEATVPSVEALNAATNTEIAYADTVGETTVVTDISGPLSELALSNLTATLSQGDLNGTYRGNAVISDRSTLNGELEVSSQALRSIAAKTGTPLPASTDAGPIFEQFSLDGQVSGPIDQIRLTDATLRLDDLQGTGAFGIDIGGERPKLTGNLTTGALDLQPYMQAYSAARPSGAIRAWSEEPLPSESLRAFDADLTVSASSIRLPQLALGATRAEVTLTDGRLQTDIPQLALYGGTGSGQLVFDASSASPTLTLDATLESLQAGNFLSAVAGFTQVEGTGATRISLRGSGNSQAALIRSLAGNGDFTLSDGVVRGIDASEFMSGLQTALTNRSLPGGIGPSKSTDYRLIDGRFDMNGGVASIGQFSLSAADVAVTGSGQVDLGAQTIDFRLRPRAVGSSANALASFGIPIRFRGPFGGATPQLDSDFLGEILQARAASEAQKLFTGALGGNRNGNSSQAGGLLGSILGSQSPAQPEPSPDAQTENPQADQQDSKATEEKEAKPEDLLLELFGVKKR